MKIQGVEIQQHQLVKRVTGLREVRTLYCGCLICKGMPVHGLRYYQANLTKVEWSDEYGKRHWGEPETMFRLENGEIPFYSLESLITYYNTKQKLRELHYAGYDWQISSCGTVIIVGGQRRPVRTHRTKRQRLKHEVSYRNRRWNARRLVALAWIGEPENDRHYVLLKNDKEEDNIHYTNLYWNASSHSDEESDELKNNLKQYN